MLLYPFFAIRIKELLSNPDYTPNKTNSIETYDSKLLNPDAVDEYISNLLSTRLKKLNAEIDTLISIKTPALPTPADSLKPESE